MIDLEKLRGELEKDIYADAIKRGDHVEVARLLNLPTIEGDSYVSLADLANILGTGLCIPRLQRAAANTTGPVVGGVSVADLCGTLLWQMEGGQVTRYRLKNPAIAQGLPLLEGVGVLPAEVVAAIHAAAVPDMQTPAQAAGIVDAGGSVSIAEVGHALNGEAD